MSIKTVRDWFWNYLSEALISTTLCLIVFEFWRALAYSWDSFAEWEIIQMCVWAIFAIAAINCMFNTATGRVAAQEAKPRETDGNRMSIRTVLKWFWNYLSEALISTALFVMMLIFYEVTAYHRDSFAVWENMQMGMWILFALAAIICMHNTAIYRVAIQDAKSRERKVGL